MVFPSVSQLCPEFPHPPEIGSPFFPCWRWRLLDPNALPLPVKPGKSRQIVASRTADPRASDQATIFPDGTEYPGKRLNVRFFETRTPRARGVAYAAGGGRSRMLG